MESQLSMKGSLSLPLSLFYSKIGQGIVMICPLVVLPQGGGQRKTGVAESLPRLVDVGEGGALKSRVELLLRYFLSLHAIGPNYLRD